MALDVSGRRGLESAVFPVRARSVFQAGSVPGIFTMNAALPVSVPMALATLGGTVFWSAGYVLMIRRGWKDKTFAEPVVVSCVNLAWEFLFSFHYTVRTFARYGNIAWMALSAVLVWMAWRFGPEDFANPLVKSALRPSMVAMLGACLLLEWGFVEAYQDYFGKALGSVTAVINAAMFLALLLRRGSVRGQSVYIALAMLLGNLCTLYLVLQPFPHLPPPEPPAPPETPPVLVKSLFAVLLPLNVAYVVMIIAQCRKEGVAVWRRW
jgi:hypothetical protein